MPAQVIIFSRFRRASAGTDSTSARTPDPRRPAGTPAKALCADMPRKRPWLGRPLPCCCRHSGAVRGALIRLLPTKNSAAQTAPSRRLRCGGLLCPNGETHASDRPVLPSGDPEDGLLLRRQDGPCAPPRREGQVQFPVASAPVRQDPAGGHAAGVVRGKRGVVPGPRRARRVGLVGAPSCGWISAAWAVSTARTGFGKPWKRSWKKRRCRPASNRAPPGRRPFPAPELHERTGQQAVVLVDEQAGRARRPGTGAGRRGSTTRSTSSFSSKRENSRSTGSRPARRPSSPTFWRGAGSGGRERHAAVGRRPHSRRDAAVPDRLPDHRRREA